MPLSPMFWSISEIAMSNQKEQFNLSMIQTHFQVEVAHVLADIPKFQRCYTIESQLCCLILVKSLSAK